jgi:MFS family permease
MAGPGTDSVTTGETLYCVNHPHTETLLRCSRCLDPICVKCAVRAPVGLRCPKCARLGRSPLYVVEPQHYLVAALVALAAALVAGAIFARLGLLLSFFLAAPAGGLIAEAVARAVRKRGRALQCIAAGSIVVGALVGPVLWWLLSRGAGVASPAVWLRSLLRLETLVYAVLAVGAAVARLR